MSVHRILALVKYASNGASSRVRFWNLGSMLKARGYEIEIVPLLSNEVLARYYASKRHSYSGLIVSLCARIAWLFRKKTNTIYWIEKEILFGLPACAEALLGPKLDRCVIDYDDAVYLNYRDRVLGPVGRWGKFARYATKAAHITVGSEYLRRSMTDLGCRRLTKIPSTVFVERYPIKHHSPRGTVVIGWIGTPITAILLDHLKEPLRELARHSSFQLQIVGAEWSCSGIDVRCIPWSERGESELVGGFDIGIMPLVDGEWQRAKCSYKIIQYMAAGVVAVGSRVGENNFVICDGVDGFLAGSNAEWLEKLKRLCGDAKLRAQVGARARAKALAQFDVSRAVDDMDRVFQDAFGRFGRGV